MVWVASVVRMSENSFCYIGSTVGDRRSYWLDQEGAKATLCIGTSPQLRVLVNQSLSPLATPILPSALYSIDRGVSHLHSMHGILSFSLTPMVDCPLSYSWYEYYYPLTYRMQPGGTSAMRHCNFEWNGPVAPRRRDLVILNEMTWWHLAMG